MKMTSLKRTKAGNKEAVSPGAADGEEYGYGTRINLDHDDLEKLGIEKLPDTESAHEIHARVRVRRTETAERDGEKRRSMELQITHMAPLKPYKAEASQEQKPGAGVRRDLDDAYDKSAAKK